MGAIHRLGDAIRECFEAPGTSLLREVEGRLVADAFRYCDSNQVRTAELLGVSRNVVRTLLKRYSLIADNADAEGLDPRPLASGVMASVEQVNNPSRAHFRCWPAIAQ